MVIKLLTKYWCITSKDLPIGDFDGQRPTIGEPHRLYKTLNGYRVFYTDRWRPNISVMMRQMTADGADYQYTNIVPRLGFYSTRITPKDPKGECAASLITEVGPRFNKWDNLIRLHDELTAFGGRLG